MSTSKEEDPQMAKEINGTATFDDYDTEEETDTEEDTGRRSRKRTAMQSKASSLIQRSVITKEWMPHSIFGLNDPIELLNAIRTKFIGVSHLSVKAAEKSVFSTRQTHFDRELKCKVTETLDQHLIIIEPLIAAYNSLAPSDEQWSVRIPSTVKRFSASSCTSRLFEPLRTKLSSNGVIVENGKIVMEQKGMETYKDKLREYNMKRLDGRNET
jgi:hypothetical protein